MSFRIAVLEGDVDILEGRRMLLEGHSDLTVVYEQSRADMAIAEITDQLIDLILIDLRLQGTDGVSAAKRIAERFAETEQAVPKMILTAPYGSDQLAEAAAAAGITAVVSVADGPTALVDAIEQALTL